MVEADLLVVHRCGLGRDFQHRQVVVLLAQAEEHPLGAAEPGDDLKAQDLGIELFETIQIARFQDHMTDFFGT